MVCKPKRITNHKKRPLPLFPTLIYMLTHQINEAILNINSNDLEDVLAHVFSGNMEKL